MRRAARSWVVRDGQKWVALAVPGYAVAAAGAVVTLRTGPMSRLREQRKRRFPAGAVASVCCAALIAVLADLAVGVGGAMSPVRYPGGWAAVAARINADPRPVAVLPADTMRRFGWSGPAPVLDPLQRWVRADVLSTGDLTISGRTVLGEGGRARDVQRLLLDGAEPAKLAGAGIGWVVVESGTAGEMGSAAKTLAALPVSYRDTDITLYRVGGDAPGAAASRRTLMVLAHLVWLTVLAAGALGTAIATVRRRLRRASRFGAAAGPGAGCAWWTSLIGRSARSRSSRSSSMRSPCHSTPCCRRRRPMRWPGFPGWRPTSSTTTAMPACRSTACVVDTGTRRILVDTCVGDMREGLHLPPLPSAFLDRLDEAGYSVEDIDTVVCTHLHFDHVGWNTRLVDGEWVVTFPNARYLFGRPEWEHWATHGDYCNVNDTVRPVIEAGAVDLVEVDHRICDEVRLVPTPGHTPGHVSVVVESGGERAVITGDMAHHPVQFAVPDLPMPADSDTPTAVVTRRRFLQEHASGRRARHRHPLRRTHGRPGAARRRRLAPRRHLRVGVDQSADQLARQH